MGLWRISASALIAANPTRKPVKDPGPETTMNAPMSFFVKPCLARRAAICGTSCAEKVPPVRETSSIIGGAPVFAGSATRAIATLPSLPEVSVTRRSILSLPVSLALLIEEPAIQTCRVHERHLGTLFLDSRRTKDRTEFAHPRQKTKVTP